MKIDSTTLVQELYRTATHTRVDFEGRNDDAVRYYNRFIDFISRVAPLQRDGRKPDLLDVGCGSGWSSFCLAKLGYQTTGLDLNARAFEPPRTQDLTFTEGSALALSFQENSFDVVTCYQCLEHIPQPEIALKEMLRVCRPSGVICIVGPNLVTPLLPIKLLLIGVKGKSLLFKRHPETARHPYGNTAFEHLQSICETAVLLSNKLSSRQVRFTMRIPDMGAPFHGDNDACYLCNPIDLKRFFRNHGCNILQNGRHGRLPMSHLLAGGTWLAVQKANEGKQATWAI